MKYSSKQKLAMAMAATMVVAVVPQMAFAASDVEMVLQKLNSTTGRPAGMEDEAQVAAGNLKTAKDAFDAADALGVKDPKALQLIKTYKASYDVLNSKTEAEFNANMATYKAELAILATGLRVGFESQATVDKHEAVKTKLTTPSTVTAVYTAKVNETLAVTLLTVELNGAVPADVTAVLVNGVAPHQFGPSTLNPANLSVKVLGKDPITSVKLTVKGKDVEATPKP